MDKTSQDSAPQMSAWQEHVTTGDFPEWHAYSVGGVDNKRITLFVDPHARSEHVDELKKKVLSTQPGSTVDIFKIPRFRRTQGPAAVSRLAHLPSPTLAHPGDQITATADHCGSQTLGTIGAFLKGMNGDVWLLSNSHVLVPGPFCLPDVTVQSASGKLLSNKVVSVNLQRLGNHVDAAIAKVAESEIMVVYPGITLTKSNPPSSPLSSSSVVVKLGALTRVTQGHFVGVVNRIEIGDPQGAVHEFVNQLLIKSIDGGPFLTRGDSGSLAVADGQPLGLLFANPDGDPHDPVTEGENPSLFGLANPFADVITALNGQANDQFTLMLPQG